MKLNEIPKDRPADGSGSGYVPASAYEPVFTAPQDPTAKLSPLKDFSEQTVRDRLAQLNEAEATQAAALEMVLYGVNEGPMPDAKSISDLLLDLHSKEIAASARVLYQLAQPGAPDFFALANEMELARKESEKARLRLLEYLDYFPRLKVESQLRDSLISCYILNAAHRLRSLHIFATTGLDPDAPEVFKECAHAD